MTAREQRRRIHAQALPIIGGMASQNVLNLVDAWMIGALGAAALAGVGLASFLVFVAVAFISGLAPSVQSIAAQRYGAGRFGEAARALNGGLLLSLAIGIPISVLLSVPLAVLGAVGLTWLRRYDNNIYTQIGIVLLIGLAAKSAIMIVEFANQLQKQGLSKREAIEEAASIRMRPVLMTTAALVVAMFPLLMADGPGAASRFSMGLIIAAGMTIGTLFTLYVVPAAYMYIGRDYSRDRAAETVTNTPTPVQT